MPEFPGYDEWKLATPDYYEEDEERDSSDDFYERADEAYERDRDGD